LHDQPASSSIAKFVNHFTRQLHGVARRRHGQTKYRAFLAAGLVCFCLGSSQPAMALDDHSAPFMRFPNTSDDLVAFVARGDLWTAPLSGGRASRLTHDPGNVAFPRLSPDGHWVAFTASRGGTSDVYVMPAAGGDEKRLTFRAFRTISDAEIVAWTPDSRAVVFLSSSASPSHEIVRAFSVPIEGGYPQTLPLDHTGLLSFAPGGHVIAYNRIFRNSALPKRYLGGQHQNIFTYDFDTKQLIRITDWKGTDTAPMWCGKTIYFLSDRGAGFRANIWAYDTITKAVRQITHFNTFDVDSPSFGGRTISFQQGGQLFAIDLPSEKLRALAIDVFDDGARTSSRMVAAGAAARDVDAKHGVDFALSPDGAELVLSAQGDLFGLRAGRAWRNITATPSADEDHPSWSPDGKQIAYVTDSRGEQQIAVRPSVNGSERVLTNFSSGVFYTPVWSPSEKQLLLADAAHELWLVPLDGGSPRLLAQDPVDEIRDATFSPDEKWVSYSTMRLNRQRAIHLQALADGRDWIVSSPMQSDRMPRFSADGRVLFFVSQRHEQPLVSDRDDESIIATLNSDGLYAATFDPADPSPVGPQVTVARPLHWDLAGLMDRAVALAIDPAVITSLEVRQNRIFYEAKPPQLIDGDLAGTEAQFHVLDPETGSDRVLARRLTSHSLASDGGAVAFRAEGSWHITGTGISPRLDVALDPSVLQVTIDPRQAWKEMLQNAWRLDRDVFFSKVMNGTNWQLVWDAYAALLPHVGSDEDFLYLLGQMQGELASSHTFLHPGRSFDTRIPVRTGLLGADYTHDAASGRYRFARILIGDNSRDAFRNPLTAPGLNVHEGDYLLAINGRELKMPDSPDAFLVGSAAQSSIVVASSLNGPRRMLQVTPLQDETTLRRFDWMSRNRARVDRLSNGRIGYVALSDFSGPGWGEFVRQFYPQAVKDGLVIDVRWNLGGFTSQAVLDVLRRMPVGVFINRERALSSLPVVAPPRTMVTLLNWGSSSDGDQFPYFFREYGLGPLVGTRSWGGVQGINRPWSLMDGTALTIPKDALADPAGHWVIENTGVEPDVMIDDRPDELASGGDVQLETAVATALARLATHPPAKEVAAPALPAYPASGDVPGASISPLLHSR
jgi:tricorn protease